MDQVEWPSRPAWLVVGPMPVRKKLPSIVLALLPSVTRLIDDIVAEGKDIALDMGGVGTY